MKMYLAIPYSHPDKKVREQRFELANRITAWLYEQGITEVFSPISHSHPIAKYLPEKYHTDSFDFWMGVDKPFMDWADKLLIVDIEGVMDSPGVRYEYKRMVQRQGKPWMFVRERNGEFYLTSIDGDLFY